MSKTYVPYKFKNIKEIDVDNLNIKFREVREDYVIYYDDTNTLGFEAHFDNNGEFNGDVAYCLQLDTHDLEIIEEWHIMDPEENIKLYNFIKNEALKDFK